VEAAAYRGRPVWFNLLGQWSRAWRMEPFAATRDAYVALGIMISLLIAVLSVASVLARRHWRMGRGDRRGAQRLASLAGVGNLVASMLVADHTLGVAEVGLVFRLIAGSLLTGGIIWVLYLAVEPYVRRQWPHRLIAWTRLLSGAWRDPLVGRDIVLGTCAGAAMALCVSLVRYLPEYVGAPPQRPDLSALEVLLGTPETLSTILAFLLQAVFLAMGFMVLAMLLRMILRREWAAAGALILLMGLQQAFGMEMSFWVALPFGLVIWTIPILVLLRYGLVAFSAGLLVIFLVANLPLTSRLDHWSAAPTLWVLAVVGGVALWGFYTSLGGRSPFGDSLDS
jgi:serine/threonine-protein kinase